MADDQPKLNTDEKSKIRLEEEYRAAVRAELNTPSLRQEPNSVIWRFVNSSFGLWLLSADLYHRCRITLHVVSEC